MPTNGNLGSFNRSATFQKFMAPHARTPAERNRADDSLNRRFTLKYAITTW
jgi:hypothetical protein